MGIKIGEWIIEVIAHAFHETPGGAKCRLARGLAGSPHQRTDFPLVELAHVMPVLDQAPEGLAGGLGVQAVPVERDQRARPVQGFGNARRFHELATAQLLHEAGDLHGEPVGNPGTFARTISTSFSNGGCSI